MQPLTLPLPLPLPLAQWQDRLQLYLHPVPLIILILIVVVDRLNLHCLILHLLRLRRWHALRRMLPLQGARDDSNIELRVMPMRMIVSAGGAVWLVRISTIVIYVDVRYVMFQEE